MTKTEININTAGTIPWSSRREIANILRDCYRRFGSSLPYKIDVVVVEKDKNVKDILKEEKLKRGILDDRQEGIVLSSYDGWRGYPKIIINYERLSKLGRLAKMGALRHEAAHTVLHGSLEYWIFDIPESYSNIATIKSLEPSVLDAALYLVSIAVKDMEATRFLIEHDYIDSQFAFFLESLDTIEKLKANWKKVKENRQERFLHQVGLLRAVLMTHPLLSLPRSKNISLEHQVMLGKKVEDMVEYLGDPEKNRLFRVANAIIENTEEDTHQKVNFSLKQALTLT